MFTVIFPTMWKFDRFLDFLEDLVQNDYVGEIIIVDNNFEKRPQENILKNEKIKFLNFGKNIYTNASWNEAVKISKFEKICICNDDVIFDLRLLRKAEPHVTQELGVMGISAAPWYEHHIEGKIIIKEYGQNDGQWGFFLCFFVHKASYQPVPETLKLYFGDNFIYDNCLFNNLTIKVIKDVWIYTPTGGATTSKTLPEKEWIQLNVDDALEYKKILLSNGVTDPYTYTPSISMILEKFAPEYL